MCKQIDLIDPYDRDLMINSDACVWLFVSHIYAIYNIYIYNIDICIYIYGAYCSAIAMF